MTNTEDTQIVLTPCVLWPGQCDQYGYGIRYIKRRKFRVHRLAWADAHGEIPEGMLVCHHCDNPPCYNIEHLYLGTDKQNALDREARGRQYHPRGAAHVGCVLTWEQVCEIRRLAAKGYPGVILAGMFQVSRTTISNIKNNKVRTSE